MTGFDAEMKEAKPMGPALAPGAGPSAPLGEMQPFLWQPFWAKA